MSVVKEASKSSSYTSGTINVQNTNINEPISQDPIDLNPSDQEPAQGIDRKVSSSNQYIRIRVITSDRTNEIHFRLKYDIPMIRMKRAYASKFGLNADELRFVFDGLRITDNDTPKTLRMADEDVVEIYQERTGGGM